MFFLQVFNIPFVLHHCFETLTLSGWLGWTQFEKRMPGQRHINVLIHSHARPHGVQHKQSVSSSAEGPLLALSLGFRVLLGKKLSSVGA